MDKGVRRLISMSVKIECGVPPGVYGVALVEPPPGVRVSLGVRPKKRKKRN